MDYSKYKDAYDNTIVEQWKEGKTQMDIDTLRGLMYGFTFTPDFAKGSVEEALSMDYWRERWLDCDDDDDGVEGIDFGLDPTKSIEDAINGVNDSGDDYMVSTKQERLIMEMLDSTGDGKSTETAIAVIDVGQEYEYLRRKFPYDMLTVELQELVDGVDCLHFKENHFGVECIYFDISCKFQKLQ